MFCIVASVRVLKLCNISVRNAMFLQFLSVAADVLCNRSATVAFLANDDDN